MGRGGPTVPGVSGGAVRVTTKGQVTIPIAIRQQLGLEPGSEVEFEIDGDVVRLRKVPTEASRGRRVLHALRTARYQGPSTEELMAHTRGDE